MSSPGNEPISRSTRLPLPTSSELQSQQKHWQWGSFLIGMGLGGFFDGIVFHQILQWHDLLSSVYPPHEMDNMRLNMWADGWFHAVTWLMTLTGIVLVWRGTRRAHAGWPTRPFAGYALMGWGVFNLLEGLINHQLLGIHHVRPGPYQLPYDLALLLWGAVTLLGGFTLRRAKEFS